MEDFFGWVIILGIFFVPAIFRALRGNAREKTYKEAVSRIAAEKARIGKFRVRAIRKKVTNDDYDFEVFEIQVRGFLPVKHDETACSIIVNMFDDTNGTQPVLCVLDDFQEEHSRVYQIVRDIGSVTEGAYYDNWSPVGVAIIETLITPRQGGRKISFQACLIPNSNPPVFRHGFVKANKERILAVAHTEEISFQFDDFGYLDATDNRKKTERLTIELAFYVAASDGNIEKEEGTTIKEWASRLIADTASDNRDDVKGEINSVIKESFNKALNNQINHVETIFELNQVATHQEKYEAIELFLDVMSSDGHAAPEELKILDEISKMLEIDPNKFRALQDRRLANVKSIGTTRGNMDMLLGITDDMSADEIRKHLSKEYRKWNSRVTSGDEGVKQKAQEMLLLIGEARKKHVSAEA